MKVHIKSDKKNTKVKEEIVYGYLDLQIMVLQEMVLC